jgi:succinate dehydrogenase / fumarate reductase flavoprotein subunit
MTDMAPEIIYLFDRMGVPFSRTKEGLLDFRRFGGTLHHRTAFAGASTGQQLLYALDEQVRKFETGGSVTKYEGWEMLSLVLDDHQVCRGLIAMNLQTLELKAFPADAVIIATGGPGLIFGKSTNSMVCTGSAVSAAYQQGAKYANGEFIQVHPTSIPGEDKLRLMSESARGEGGRVWVPRKQGDTRSPSSIPENAPADSTE